MVLQAQVKTGSLELFLGLIYMVTQTCDKLAVYSCYVAMLKILGGSQGVDDNISSKSHIHKESAGGQMLNETLQGAVGA